MFRLSSNITLFILMFMGFSRSFAQRSGDFGPYQIILDQQLLARSAPEPPPQQPEIRPSPPPSWATEYRLTMITEDLYSGKGRVGLYHLRNEVGYLLIEGETYTHDFALESVEFPRNQATISYQGVRHTFRLEEASLPASRPEVQPAPRQPSNRTVRRVNLPPAPAPEPETDSPPPEPRFSSPEELQAHLQNVQMDAIRTGKPPLPIPLTPEMDAQLVQEGVLPPLEE